MLLCARPWAFWGLVLLVPAILLFLLWYHRVSSSRLGRRGSLPFPVRRALWGRALCWCMAWILMMTALGGLSWGTHLVPVQRTGSSLSFVFDISWSMMAQDVPSGDGAVSRLEAASAYVEELLEHLDGAEVSVVLAKGEGIAAIPLTRDYNALRSLLPALSPRLMTTAGSSLGSGLSVAATTFPLLSVAKKTVVLLTDGEESDGMLETETRRLVAAGIDVVFLGFGSLAGGEVVAGDGKTVVHSALRAGQLEAVVAAANGAAAAYGEGGVFVGGKAVYLPAQSQGSAHEVLSVMREGLEGAALTGAAYQVERKERWRPFAVFALVFLCAGFVFGELSPARVKEILFRDRKRGSRMLLLMVPLLFSGCSMQWRGAAAVLEGAFSWHRGNYSDAISSFMEAMEVAEMQDAGDVMEYSLYGLAATYMMQGEMSAAQSRLRSLSPDGPVGVRFASLYAGGIIAYNQGEFQRAASLFRQALEVDASSVEAKINLELSLGQEARQRAAASQELIPVEERSGEDSAGATLFSLIRAQEQERWRSQQLQHEASDGDDY